MIRSRRQSCFGALTCRSLVTSSIGSSRRSCWSERFRSTCGTGSRCSGATGRRSRGCSGRKCLPRSRSWSGTSPGWRRSSGWPRSCTAREGRQMTDEKTVEPGVVVSMRAYMAAHAGLRYIFLGGKGGVGKTVMAGATALWTARQGRRTILASTNPVHSLSGLLGQDVFGRHTPVEGVPNLWAYEIDTRETIERSKAEIKDKIQWFLKFADISTRADEFVESATMNPAFEESAMFENMVDLMLAGAYDTYVFDTAPTANARRLLGMSRVYSLWVDKMLKSRQEAQSLREMLSFSKKKESDPLMEYLLSFRERISHARDLLTDPQQTAFFFVTLPEALPIAVIKRFINWFHDFGIPVGGVIVNMLIQKNQVKDDSPEFVRNRVAMQDYYMEEIWRDFNNVRAVVPLLDNEVRGVEALGRVAEYVFPVRQVTAP